MRIDGFVGIAADISLIVVFGLVLGAIAHRLGQPLLVGSIAAGVLLGPHTGGITISDPHEIELLRMARESLPSLESAGLLDRFEVVVTRLDVEKFKPDPAGLIECMDRMGVTPAETVYVGDSRIDVQASLAAGVMSIAVLCGAGDSASLSAAGAHRLVADIASLPDLFELA